MISLTKCVLLLVIGVSTSLQEDCAESPVGPDLTFREFLDLPESHQAYLALDSGYIECNGILKEWSFYQNEGSEECYDIIFQIWRQTSDDHFSLVAEYPNLFTTETCTNDTVQVFKLPGDQQIPVQPGDIMGWYEKPPQYNGTEAIIPYDAWSQSGSLRYGRVRVLEPSSTCSMNPGDHCKWERDAYSEDPTKELIRDYSLQITVGAQTDVPVWLNLGDDDGNVKEPQVELPEYTPIGHVVYHAHAFYNFSSNPAIPPLLTYSFSDEDCKNSLSINDDGLITTAEIMTAQQCEIGVNASHGSAHSASGKLTIIYTDVNEPHLVHDLPHSSTLNTKDPQPPSPIHTVIAEDPIDLSSDVTFLITNAIPPFPSPPLVFTQSRESNNINKLEIQWDDNAIFQDHLNPASFQMWITATDSKEFAVGPQLFTVNLENLRQPPVIGNLPDIVEIEETLGSTSIFTVELTEPKDSRSDSQFSIRRIIPSSGWNFFEINTVTGEIKTKQAEFDYFKTSEYLLYIVVEDDLFASEIKSLKVKITWVNQLPVMKAPHTIQADIDELQPIGTRIPGVTLIISDRDLPIGDWLDVIILDEPNAYLISVDNATMGVNVNGLMTVPDHEASTIFKFRLRAHDSNAAFAERDVDLVLTVHDINNHAPVFEPSFYNGTVNECAMGGMPTGITVGATDADGPVYGLVSYSIVEDWANQYFQVDAVHGNITMIQPINHTEIPHAKFTVLARDGGSPPFEDTATVEVAVVPCNTHRPQFIPNYYDIELRSDVEVGTSVLGLTVLDPDSNEVQQLEFYHLVLQDDFNVLPQSGVVVPSRKLKSYGDYHLYVNVRDNGVPDEYFSDVAVVRVSTYSPSSELISIELKMPLQSFIPIQSEFIHQLNKDLYPWVVAIDNVYLDHDRTYVTVYAIEDNSTTIDPSSPLSDIQEILLIRKVFVGKDDLLRELRRNLFGDPRSLLRSTAFAAYQPISVHPTYLCWLTDTPEGIAVLTLLCLLALLLLLLPVCLAKKKGWLCFAKRQVKPQEPPIVLEDYEEHEHFKLRYGDMQPARRMEVYDMPHLPGTADITEEFGRPSRDPKNWQEPGGEAPMLSQASPPPSYFSPSPTSTKKQQKSAPKNFSEC